MGRRFKREGTYVYLWLIHADVWQKPTQQCKAIPAVQETHVRPLGQDDPLEKEMQPTLVFLPGKSHGQRSLGYYNPCGRKVAWTQLTHWLKIILKNTVLAGSLQAFSGGMGPACAFCWRSQAEQESRPCFPVSKAFVCSLSQSIPHQVCKTRRASAKLLLYKQQKNEVKRPARGDSTEWLSAP